jgi:hypothetical protein
MSSKRKILFLEIASSMLALFALIVLFVWLKKDYTATNDVRVQLLRDMDRDHDHKVSKQEFVIFMEHEFDRIDKNNDGLLTAEELSQLGIGYRKDTGRRAEGKLGVECPFPTPSSVTPPAVGKGI